MRTRLTLAALALTLAVGACDREAPTSPAAVTDDQTTATAKKTRGPLIFPVQPTKTFLADGSGSLAAGTPVTVGGVQITKFSYVDGQLLVDGFLRDASGAKITDSEFAGRPATLTSQGSPTQPSCQILDLRIGQIRLDLLGLLVVLDPVHLNITAFTGPGNLLGNLLCALVGILDPPGPLARILALLDRINAILSQL